MENSVQQFDFKGHPVRVEEKNGVPWLAVKDVLDVLAIKNVTTALQGIDQKHLTFIKSNSGGQMRKLRFIDEVGLYRLVFRSNKPEADAFAEKAAEIMATLRYTVNFSANGQTGAIQEAINKTWDIREDYRFTKENLKGMFKELMVEFIQSDFAEEIAVNTVREVAIHAQHIIGGRISATDRINTLLLKQYGPKLIETYRKVSGFDLRLMYEDALSKGTTMGDLWQFIIETGHIQRLEVLAEMWEV
jgi:prophage antirepressor-like protein